MSTTYNHIRMSTVDASNNVAVLYPETTASDVSVSRTNNANIPQSATNIQLLANALATSAFTNPISDSTTSSTSTWSSSKINTALTNVSVYVDSTDGKLHFVNSAGTDSALNFNKASGTATADKVLTGFTFSNSSGIDIPGEMVNNGAISQTVNPGSSYTIPAGYHNGNGVVTANTVENTLTYTFASGSTGATVDLGANNTYRYVNAANVYAKGQADGATTHTGTFSVGGQGTFDMGEYHTYRYAQVSNFTPEALGNTLENSSWAAIAYHAYIGDLSSSFSTGATKTLTLNAVDGVSSQTLTMVLADFNHDNNTGTVDFICKDCMSATHAMNYGSTKGRTNNFGFSQSNMRAYLNGPVFNSIPTTCSNYIIEKDVMTYGGSSYNSPYHSNNKIWLLTEKEVGLSSYANASERNAQTTYPIFTNDNSRIKNLNGSAYNWWLASPHSGNTYNFCRVYSNGTAYNHYASSANGVVFGFRL